MSLFADVRTLIDEPSVGVFWTDAQVYDAMNEAVLEVWESSKWATSTATLTLTASTDIIPLPSTIMIPQFYLGTSTNEYFLTTPGQLEEWNREWRRLDLAYPKHLVLWDATHLRVVPKPDQTYLYTLVGVSWPTAFDSGNQDITAPHQLKQTLMFRAASILLEATLPDLADTLMAQSIEEEREFLEQVRNSQSHNIRRLRPGTAFTVAQGGNIRRGQVFK